MKNKYRITFHDGPLGNRQKTVDIYAESLDEARQQGYQMPEARNRLYDNMMIHQVPEGPSVIGIEFEFEMKSPPFYENGKDYLFIRANSEAEALQYYNTHFLAQRYSSHAGTTDPAGHRVRGRVTQTYYADGMQYCADATNNSQSLDDKVSVATARASVSDSGQKSQEQVPAAER